MMKKIILSILLCAAFPRTSFSQTEAKKDSMFWFMKRKDFATYTTILWSTGAVVMEFQWWWRDDYLYKKHPFHLKSDGYFYNYSYGVDKLGHMFTSYLFFHTTYDFLRWADIDENTALWSSIAVPAAHAIAIEFADGFSKYAFNPSDLYFNFAGIGYGVLQVKYPFLRNFNIKWGYWPTVSVHRPNPDWGPASDYSGHIYWLSMNVHDLLPEKVQPYWPRFLNLAVGMGAENVSFGDTGPKKRKFAVGLDWNLTELPLTGDTWGVLKNLVDKIHFPAPGIRFVEGEKTEGKALLLH